MTDVMTTPTKHVAHIATDLGLSIFIDGTSYVVAKDHPNYKQIVAALEEKRYDDIPRLADLPKVIEEAIQEFTTDYPGFRVQDGVIYYKDKPFSYEVSQKVIQMAQNGAPVEPLLRFLEKLRRNPSASAQREALLFFAANNMMIHEDGDFLAYKTVNPNYYDKYTRTVLNKPAHLLTDKEIAQLPYTTQDGVTVAIENGVVVVSMDRADVDDRRENTCSFGLHFAAYDYASRVYFSPWDRIVVLKIDPRDVVSIPYDYQNQKGRCCRYEVIAELPAPKETTRPDPLPEKVVYSYSDVGASDPVKERVLKVISKLTGRPVNEIGLEDEWRDLGITLEELGDALNTEFDTSFEVHEIGFCDTVDELVYLVQDELNWLEEEDEDEEDPWSGDEDEWEDEEEDEEDTSNLTVEVISPESETTQYKFSVGDFVKIVDENVVGKVLELDIDLVGSPMKEGRWYYVDLPSGVQIWRREDDLEVAKPKFSIGQKVVWLVNNMVREITDVKWMAHEDKVGFWYSFGEDFLWYFEGDLDVFDPDVKLWNGHRFKDGVCLNCKGKQMPLESLGWECSSTAQ